VTYSTDQRHPANLQSITTSRAHEIIAMNKRGEKPMELGGKQSTVVLPETDYQNVVGQDDLTRFDKKKNNNKNQGGNRDHRHHDRRHNRNNEKGYSDRNN
jgi:hypothetical protein